MHCFHCGTPIIAGTRFCMRCGSAVAFAPPAAAFPHAQAFDDGSRGQPLSLPATPASTASSVKFWKWLSIGLGLALLVFFLIILLQTYVPDRKLWALALLTDI